MDDKTLRDNFTSGETWTRGLFMVLFAILYSIAEIVVGAVVVFQFVATLLTGRRNDRLLQLGADLSNYIYHCLRFLTYASDDRPYPFSAWPSPDARPEPPPARDGTEAADSSTHPEEPTAEPNTAPRDH